jgi:hypothetical protein
VVDTQIPTIYSAHVWLRTSLRAGTDAALAEGEEQRFTFSPHRREQASAHPQACALKGGIMSRSNNRMTAAARIEPNDSEPTPDEIAKALTSRAKRIAGMHPRLSFRGILRVLRSVFTQDPAKRIPL